MNSMVTDWEAIARRKIVVAEIARQALTIPDWQQHCAELMTANEVTVEDVRAALRIRALGLVFLQPVLCSIIWAYPLTLGWERTPLVVSALGALFLDVFVFCIFYCPVLIWMRAKQRYMPLMQMLAIGCLVMPPLACVLTYGIALWTNLSEYLGSWMMMLLFTISAWMVVPAAMAFWTVCYLCRPLSPKSASRSLLVQHRETL